MEESNRKKTGRFGRFMGWLVSILLVGAVAGGLVFLYPWMMREAEEVYKQREYSEIQEYIHEASYLVDGMYVDWYQHTKGRDKTAGEIVLGPLVEQYADEESYLNWYARRSNELAEWYTRDYRKALEEVGIQYFVYRDSVETGYGSMNPEEVRHDAGGYPMFIEIQYDASGIPTIHTQCGAGNLEDIQSIFTTRHTLRMLKNETIITYATMERATHNELKNVTVLLAYDEATYEEVKEVEGISRNIVWRMQEEMELNYVILVLAAIGMVVLLGFLLPTIRPLGLKEGWKAHIPLELLFLLGVLVSLPVVEVLPELIVASYLEVKHPGTYLYWIGIMKDIMASGRDKLFITLANVAVWSAVFFVVYLCVINLRQLFAKGMVRFFKENTLTGRILFWLMDWGKKAVQFCGTIDFSNKGNRNFLLAVVLNFIVIAVLCCTWFFGILLAIPYSLFLFWLLQKWWNKIRTDYVVLLSTTEEMAKGVTDVEYVADAGVFHELKDALSDVQAGFHTAVQEEVKSQRMKTELITNVSHDLKTPLTAIITYVDLLKNEVLTSEERQEYVNVLDRKSARLKTLIEDLFEISKAASGNIKLDKVDLDLVRLIQEVQLELEEEIMNSGIAFKVKLPEEKVMVHLDAQKTSRIFENLTMNIIKHGLTGSRAYISLEQDEKNVTVVYRNVSSAEINYNADEILERFTRGDASRNTEGSGLGLAIVKSFAEAQGGRVKVDLEDDLFKVTVSFPRAKIEAVPKEEIAADVVVEPEVQETAKEVSE